MPKSNRCACGVTSKAHQRKAKRDQLPDRGVKTDRFGNVRPGAGHRNTKRKLMGSGYEP